MPNGLEAAPEGESVGAKHTFVSKLTDADGLRLVAYASESENGETEAWLNFAHDCGNPETSRHYV